MGNCRPSPHIRAMDDLLKIQRSLREQRAGCKAGQRCQKPADFMVNRGARFLYDHQVEQMKLRLFSEVRLSSLGSDPQSSPPTPPHQNGDDCLFPSTPTAWRNVCLFIELLHLVKDYSLSFQLSPQMTAYLFRMPLLFSWRCIFSR